MDFFEKVIKQEDYSKNEIINDYSSFLKYNLKGLSHYTQWAENELEEINKYLYGQLKTGKQRISYLESYVKNEEGKRHFLNYNIIQYIGKYYNDRKGISLIQSLKNADAKNIIKFYYEKIIPAHLLNKKRIGVQELPGHGPIPIYEKTHPTPTMMLADGLYKLYQQAENESATPQEKGRICIEWTPERIVDLEKCKKELKLFYYSDINAIKDGVEKIDMIRKRHGKHDAISLLTIHGLQEPGTENTQDKIISDNFTYLGNELKAHDIQVMRKNHKNQHDVELRTLLNK